MIIFTDIDGVLVTSKEAQKENLFNNKCVRAFNSLCNLFENTKVVVSSLGWRIGNDLESYRELFKKNGIEAEITDYIKDEYENIDKKLVVREKGKGLEILEWLKDNNYSGKYVVIDDEISDLKGFIPKQNIMHVRGGFFKKGLIKEKIREFQKHQLPKLKSFEN